MLITFQSKAAPDVTMLKDLAGYLLGLVGKRLDVRGVITHEQLPVAIERLEAAIVDDEKFAEKTTLSIMRCTRIVASIVRDFHSRLIRF